jgi:glucose/arabinose dehydrogenase
MMLAKPLFFLTALLFAVNCQAEISRDKDINIQQLAVLSGVPWGMAVLPDKSILVTLREGKLIRLNPETGETHDISGLPDDIKVGGQGGLFDIKLSPDYASNQLLYLSYAKDVEGEGATTLATAKLDGDTLSQWQDLLVTRSRTGKSVHFGGRMAFDNEGHVFLSVGERGERDNAQDLTTHAGSVLRLNLDGSVPDDNPFTGEENKLPEIWSYGHRNPQGLFYNAQSRQLWEAEHGPRGGDEINRVEKGKNYGWPEISYGKEYWAPLQVGDGTHKQGMEQPVKVYDPSIATSSLIQYQGPLFKAWQNKLLVGALKLQHLNIVSLDAKNQASDEQRLLSSLNSRIRNVIEAPDGAVIISTDSGQIYRLTPAQ